MDRIVQSAIVAELQKLAHLPWEVAEIYFDFPPFANRGYKGSQRFFDERDHPVDLVLTGDEVFSNVLFRYIYTVNQEGVYNRIRVIARRSDLPAIDIQLLFEPTLVERFEAKLPISQKGKTIPWWKNPEMVNAIGF